MALAHAASTDGHYYSPRSSGRSGPGVTLFELCFHCTPTCQLASSSLQVFLNQASVRRRCQSGPQTACAVPCRAADSGGLGYRQIQVEVLASNVMAGTGGAAGPAPDVLYQPPGDSDATEECIDSSSWI